MRFRGNFQEVTIRLSLKRNVAASLRYTAGGRSTVLVTGLALVLAEHQIGNVARSRLTGLIGVIEYADKDQATRLPAV